MMSKKKHFLLGNLSASEPFRSPRKKIDPPQISKQDRQAHGTKLLGQINGLKAAMTAACEAQKEIGLEETLGLRIEFESFSDIDLAFESLAREHSGIELLNIKQQDGVTFATVFVPDGKLTHFEQLINDYLTEKRNKNNELIDHSKLINTIKEIRAASLRELWTDDQKVFPKQEDESIWWEVWLPVRKDRRSTVKNFRQLAEAQKIRVSTSMLEFPERTVLLAYASRKKMEQSMMTLNSIAELRRAKETADFFDALSPEKQPAWAEELLSRCQFSAQDKHVPYICLLDTGVNNGHPLLTPVLANIDQHTIEPAWGTDDSEGHGTSMAGLAIFGDLTEALSSAQPLIIDHRLESVKILKKDGSNHDDDRHHGYLTTEAIYRPEISEPSRKRVFGMAVTAQDNRDRGRPSSWSAAIDRLAADAEGENATPRLILISAGNINDPNAWAEYPASNATDSIHDPGQAWNALTVGAYTELTNITEPDAAQYKAIAGKGGLSPFSTTSCTWQQHWPLKPDVVFEGGNVANDGKGAVWMPSLSLLTCCDKPHERLLTTMNATSAATALGCQMAAQLMAEYPTLWPESIRALLVHSAEWTENMRQTFLPSSRPANKNDRLSLVRHCGFGVPNIDRARWSMSNSLTMIIETTLSPFKKEGSNQPTLRDMNLHRLPWPLPELEELG